MATVSDPPARAPVTAVIAQRVRPERTGEFRIWQEQINHAVWFFAGFLGTEVVEPVDGGDEWTIVYRFDSIPNLEAWLKSSTRHELHERGIELFAAPARQQILVGKPEEDVVTVVVSHRVRAGQEQSFRTFQQRMTDAERGFEGYRGSELFPPVPGVQRDWTAIYRFDSAEHLDVWLQSPERAALLAADEDFLDFDLQRVSSPFGSWFSFAEEGTSGPPTWKTALSVLVGLYPTVVLLTLGISELWPGAVLWQSLLLGNLLSVSALTWVVMPTVTRALRFWLVPDPGAAGSRLDALGAAVSISFLTVAATVFWLGTTVIWKLP